MIETLVLPFAGGLLVSLTPCIYPMIPITAGILQAYAQKSPFFNFLAALLYILGISSVYATLGYISATSSIIFGSWMSHPMVAISVACLFVYMGLSMLGLYDLFIPSFLTQAPSLDGKKSLIMLFFIGMAAGTIASPCLTPGLAVFLAIAAKTANPIVGFLILLSFSLGMSMLLLFVGTFSGSITLLPQSGIWMDLIKQGFGFFMIGMALSYMPAIIGTMAIKIGYVIISCLAAIFYMYKSKDSKLALIFSGIACGCAGYFYFFMR